MKDNNGEVSYCLRSLAFPAFVCKEVTLDPCILFVIDNLDQHGKERVFWKYLSPSFLSTIDFKKDSFTIKFSSGEQIFNSAESVNDFAEKLYEISVRHSFIKKLDNYAYKKSDILKIIQERSAQIDESLAHIGDFNLTRDYISKEILSKLDDLCVGTLLLHSIKGQEDRPSLRYAYDLSLFDAKTAFLTDFLQFLRYIGKRIPDEGQSERLMLKYYNYLWEIKRYLKDYHNIEVLIHLSKFPLDLDDEDKEYYKDVSKLIDQEVDMPKTFSKSRYYIEKKIPFFVNGERYFELTLQLAGKYASKFNRLIVYSKEDIVTNYSIQIGYVEKDLILWEAPSKIKIITSWRVAIDPAVINKFCFILKFKTQISSTYGEYVSLMDFLTKTGMNLLDLVDLQDSQYSLACHIIFRNSKTTYLKQVLDEVRKNYGEKSTAIGRNVIRYILLRLKEELIENVYPEASEKEFVNKNLILTNRCCPFDKNPFIYNLPKNKTNNKTVSSDVIRAVGIKNIGDNLPYINLKFLTEATGELYFDKSLIENDLGVGIEDFNNSLEAWDKRNGINIKEENDYVYIDSDEKDTLSILSKLKKFTEEGNAGQQQLNNRFLKQHIGELKDQQKEQALKNIFIHSRLFMIYGAAGTGKTYLMEYISQMFEDGKKLFLTKTHTALENLQRRIKTSGVNGRFINIDQFLNRKELADYDLIFIDECSTIDNRTMSKLLEKISLQTLIVLAGDIYQIESIDFGNWFNFAKEIINKESQVELTNTWRTNDQDIKKLWSEVRERGKLITEILSLDGPYSAEITKEIFKQNYKDEIVLCLNYDGRFGLNNVNNYFQDTNPNQGVTWREWKYKIGDPVLFNETLRFPRLYNNLKGKIIDITKEGTSITFIVEVETIITGIEARNSDFDIVDSLEDSTIIKFTIYENNGGTTDEERERSRMESIVPFQVAYAVSIHKSQGLEYDSVKIVIPKNNTDRISHGIFYTAITRAKKNLKIYWSSETMNKVVESFKIDANENKNLKIIKEKLKDT